MDFCKVSPFPTSFNRKETHEKFHTPFESCEKEHPSEKKKWKKGTHDMLYKNPYFFVITVYCTKSEGVFTDW